MISTTQIVSAIQRDGFKTRYLRESKAFSDEKYSVGITYDMQTAWSLDKRHDAIMALEKGADLIGLRNEFINGDNAEKSRLWSMFVYGDLLNRNLDPSLSDDDVFDRVVDSMSDVYKRFTPPVQGKTQELVMSPELIELSNLAKIPTPELVEETLTMIVGMAKEDAKEPQTIGDKVHQRTTSLVAKIKNAGKDIKDKVETADEKLEQARPVLKAVDRPEILSDSGMNFVSAVLDAIEAKRKVVSSIKESIKTAEIAVADSAIPGIGEPLTEAKHIKDTIDGIEEDTKDAAAELIVDAVLKMDNLDDDPGLQQ